MNFQTVKNLPLHADTASLTRLALSFFMAAVIYATLTDSAYATTTPMGDVLCAIVEMVYGNLGRGLATLAIAILGVGATLGKVSWGLAVTVGVGISIIFNAGDIMVSLVGGSQCS